MRFPEAPGPRLALWVVGILGTPLAQMCGQRHPCWYAVQERFWVILFPVGSPLLHCDLFCVRFPGFAKKTFISYSKSFKNSFRQGVVVEIDLKNQTVLLEDGEVSRADSCRWETWAGVPGSLPGQRGLWPQPAWC